MNNKKITSDGLEILYERYYANNPERQLELEKARIDDEVARKIINLRESYHLSVKDLAKLINTDELAIESLENAEYEGNFFLFLTLIATALKMKVQIELVTV
jgi:ribosome-binding protein aMBF1 (putative translation factor)